jgi:phosphoglycolate phosphatase
MTRDFELLVFDWDGTLVDSITWIVECIERAARFCRLRPPAVEDSQRVIGLGLGEAMAVLYPEISSSTRSSFCTVYRDYFRSREMTPDYLFDGIVEMLGRLKSRGYKLAVATGKTRTGLEAALGSAGIAGLFDATRCADETASKPDPLMLCQLMSELRVSNHATLMIGDSVHDLRMAQNAHVEAIAVSRGADSPARLSELAPLFVLDHTTDLERVLAPTEIQPCSARSWGSELKC